MFMKRAPGVEEPCYTLEY